MEENQKPGDLKTFEEATEYIKVQLNKLNEQNSKEVAAKLVGLGANDNFEEWYKNKNFALILDNASDLEWSNGDEALLWQEIKAALQKF